MLTYPNTDFSNEYLDNLSIFLNVKWVAGKVMLRTGYAHVCISITDHVMQWNFQMFLRILLADLLLLIFVCFCCRKNNTSDKYASPTTPAKLTNNSKKKCWNWWSIVLRLTAFWFSHFIESYTKLITFLLSASEYVTAIFNNEVYMGGCEFDECTFFSCNEYHYQQHYQQPSNASTNASTNYGNIVIVWVCRE